MTVRRESFAGVYAIVVDDEQVSETLPSRIEVVRERERVTRVEPSMVRITALVRSTELQGRHGRLLRGRPYQPSPHQGLSKHFAVSMHVIAPLHAALA
jgi:hypothetical protein